MGENSTLGLAAEAAAVRFLTRRGYRILHTNWRTRRGEIDIIAECGNCLVFVEVKSSQSSPPSVTAARIHWRKRERLRLAASEFLAQHPSAADSIRFDALLMTYTPAGEWRIHHIPNAFTDD